MSELIDSLYEALRHSPDAVPLRLHLAELLLNDGQSNRAVAELGNVLAADPGNAQAQALLQRALNEPGATNEPSATSAPDEKPSPDTGKASPDTSKGQASDLDWAKLEAEIGVDIAPPFVTQTRPGDEGDPDQPGSDAEREVDESGFIVVGDGDDPKFFEEPETETITLADVGGLEKVKERLRIAFLEPMRNPEVAKAYGMSLRGGLLLYGPPGTGKTYLARAIAGELEARFLSVTLADVLDALMGQSEKNVRRLFQRARELAPCVLFIDELDSLGGKRSGYSNMGWMRNVVNQMLQEMDGVGAVNDGVFILAATNHPWDVDNALLRPGRFDRIVLVPAPDPEARAAILRHAFKGRPIAGIDLEELMRATHGFSGADLTHIAASAAEFAMSDSVASGELRPIGMPDVRRALSDIRPSTGPWLQTARNVVEFANADGRYDELKDYLEQEQRYLTKKPKK